MESGEEIGNKIKWLRASYYAAGIADVLIAILILLPDRMGETEYRYPMGLASVTVFSWGIMLFLADRKPLERRWILLPTILVISLLQVPSLYAVSDGTFTFTRVAPTLILGVVLVVLLSFSYYITRDLE